MDLNQGLSEAEVWEYLLQNERVLDELVQECVSLDQLVDWGQKMRSQGAPNTCDPALTDKSLGKQVSIDNINQTCMALMTDVCSDDGPPKVAHSVALATAQVISCKHVNVFEVAASRKEVHEIVENKGEYVRKKCDVGSLEIKKLVKVATTQKTDFSHSGESHMFQAPILLPDHPVNYIFRFTKSTDFSSSNKLDINMFLSWTSTLLYQAEKIKNLSREAKLNDFLMETSELMLKDLVTLRKLKEHMLIFVKRLLEADRCTLYLLDQERKELYSDVFDDGVTVSHGTALRFPMSCGIAGHVAKHAQTINITDAYADTRFNRDVDQMTGYRTRNMLCMPICGQQGAVLGVVQLLNKRTGDHFTDTDEANFQTFSSYCSLALHLAELYADLETESAKAELGSVMLEDYTCCSERDSQALQEVVLVTKIPRNIDSFSYYGPKSDANRLPELFVLMIHKLFGPDCFDIGRLCRLVLTIKKNYRAVPYHNFHHGWSVAHSMYSMLQALRPQEGLSELHEQALMVACLGHDVDHRGCNNAYYSKQKTDPLAVLYASSVMEEHHYAITVMLLQQDGNDVFHNLSNADYKKMLGYIRHCILATDLAAHMQNIRVVDDLLSHKQFNTNHPEHMDRALALVTTACDLSGMCIDWAISKKHTRHLVKEFVFQGDLERKLGYQPEPPLDRVCWDKVPHRTTAFLQIVCMPCYETLYKLFPQTEALRDGCRDNLVTWQRVSQGLGTLTWDVQPPVECDDLIQ